MPVHRVCEHCGASFQTRLVDVRHGNGRFCSRGCGWKGRRKSEPAPLLDRLLVLIDKPTHGNGCWRWLGHIDREGYGRFGHTQRSVLAHRTVYETVRGPIPDGLCLDHLCRNRGCVNPDHLEPVTDRVNILRGQGMGARWAWRTRCEVHGEDLVIKRDRRICMSCQRETSRKKYWRKRGVARTGYEGSDILDAESEAVRSYFRVVNDINDRLAGNFGKAVEGASK